MTIDPEAAREAIDELGAMLRADGADLLLLAVDSAADRIEIRLDLDNAGCADCVLPPNDLFAIVNQSLRRRVPVEFELVMHDPRLPT